MNDLILYPTEDGRSQIKLRADQQTVWLADFDNVGKEPMLIQWGENQ